MRTVVCFFDMLDECVAYQIDQSYIPKYLSIHTNSIKSPVSHGTYLLPTTINPLDMDASDLWEYRTR